MQRKNVFLSDNEMSRKGGIWLIYIHYLQEEKNKN